MRGRFYFAHGGAGARYDEAVLGGDLSQERFLNRQLVLPVSTISTVVRQAVEHGGRHFGVPDQHTMPPLLMVCVGSHLGWV